MYFCLFLVWLMYICVVLIFYVYVVLVLMFLWCKDCISGVFNLLVQLGCGVFDFVLDFLMFFMIGLLGI